MGDTDSLNLEQQNLTAQLDQLNQKRLDQQDAEDRQAVFPRVNTSNKLPRNESVPSGTRFDSTRYNYSPDTRDGGGGTRRHKSRRGKTNRRRGKTNRRRSKTNRRRRKTNRRRRKH